MSLVLITAEGPEHRYVANRIVAAHEVAAILLCDPAARRGGLQTLRRSPRRFADKALRQLYLRATGDAARRRAGLRRILGPESEGFARPDLLVPVGPARGPLLGETLAGLAPRIIAVYGTGVIPAAVLRLASEVALNMHTGLSPWYRGTACAFWPIVEGRPEMVGATVHECTAALDAGRIFFRERAPIFRGDDLHAIFARAVATGARGYVEVIGRALDGSLQGAPQDLRLGREYRGGMLGIAAELGARRALRRMARDLPEPEDPEPEDTGPA
jgi:methionyl-tRNA formyltransferase